MKDLLSCFSAECILKKLCYLLIDWQIVPSMYIDNVFV